MKKKANVLLGEVEVNRDLILLLTIGGLYALGIYLSNTFVNIYLWKQSGDYIDIALYNLAVYIMQPLTFILAGRWAKKIDRVIVLRLGVIFLSFFFMTVLIVGDQAATYKLLLGAVLGVGYGFYWLAFNVLTFEITEPDTRDFFNGFLGLLQSFGGMVGPILAGYIISQMSANTGYTIIFSISLILFIFAVIASFFLYRRSAEGTFSFKTILHERKRDQNWRRILYANVFQGLREGTFIFVISIWVFITTQSELALGTFNLMFSGFAFLFYYLVTRFVKPSWRKWAIFIGGLMLYVSLLLILIELSYVTLLLYAAVIGIAYPIIYVPYLSLTYDVIGKAKQAAEMRVEYIVVRELFLNFGRVISIACFLIGVTLFDPEFIIPYILMIVGAGHFIIYFFIKDIQIPVTTGDEAIFIRNELTDNENK
ncbi:MFS transporter [Pontibacillus litoralis]|uniref:Major facilitator superfamily (MFS) profile domain-containing protein n=1 Tax=Pontibacillus litoralis JSM 072002 TaxID=1385512 RepID=A0A0A5GA06_9BACI|nr:MFS transporter [Pontibacillus litoralis]KGX88889.1 hypothetical protein N784_00665 [Pontibacillus litoralis JSM 072002]